MSTPPTSTVHTASAEPGDRAAPGLDQEIAFLASPAAYPERPATVTCIETHMSWVFLAGADAYKLKKPVIHPFLDYSTAERRRHFCEEEVRLNRRLSPSIYLGVVALLLRPDGTLALGEPCEATVVDWLVRMKRLPEEAMLHRAIASGTAGHDRLVPVADLLRRFFAAAQPAEPSPAAYLSRFSCELERNRAVLHDGVYGMPDEQIGHILSRLHRFLDEERALLLTRLSAGCIIEGHGDLRPEHIHLGEPPCVIDCLEFDRALRLLDPVEELAFLALECRLIGGAEAGAFLLARCGSARLPAAPPRLVAFYTAFRACLRARLSLAHLQEAAPREPEKWRPRALAYLAEAERACAMLEAPQAAP
ncbi:MAG: hypothetical protein MUC89_00580 [Acetobacteraceae bacterium]|jgi:aminoglycoside phosphotransferase family enzyme|nr:hypothetical protein [Acetobacteraceae bacterium]